MCILAILESDNRKMFFQTNEMKYYCLDIDFVHPSARWDFDPYSSPAIMPARKEFKNIQESPSPYYIEDIYNASYLNKTASQLAITAICSYNNGEVKRVLNS